MKLRNIIIYLVVLIGIGSYLYFYEIKHKQEQKAQEDKAAKLIQLDKDKLVGIELRSPELTIDLKRPGDTWVLGAPIKTAADQVAVTSLIHSALDAKAEKVVSEQESKWDEFGLDKPAFTITLSTDDKKVELSFGAVNPSKSSYYARVDEQPKLLLVADTLKKSLNKAPFDLRDKTVMSLAPEDVDRIVISKGNETIEMGRQDKDSWMLTKPEHFKAKKAVVEAGLSSLTELKAREIIDEPKPEGDAYGLENPQESIALSGKKLDQVLLIGKPAGQPVPGQNAPQTLYSKVKGQDTIYVIDGRILQAVKTDPKDLRDRSLISFSPASIEKVEIDLDGKTLVALQGPDKKWTLEQPEKKEKLDNWAVSGMLWSLKDVEWKSVVKADMDEAKFENPQLSIKMFKKDEKEPLVLKAVWPEDEVRKPEEKASPADEKKTPIEITASVRPHDEGNVNFVVNGAFIERLREDFRKLTEK